ncbi:MAG: hypothetical protein MUO63_11305 [Desulfobulbaceae bacterium]|nr:hypothetical protein [Desulfobulbaceae bacterium]
MNETKFDHNSYNRNIKLLLDHAENEYKRHFTDLPKYQEDKLRNYLWVSAALLGLQVTIIDKLKYFPFSTKLYVSLAIFVAFIVFCIGIDSLRTREKSVFGIENYSYLLERVYGWAFADGSDRKLDLTLIDFYESAISAEIKSNIWRAGRMKLMSISLLFSGFFTTMAVICSFVD